MMLKISLVRSSNGCSHKQKNNLRSLNLKRIGDVALWEESQSFFGRLKVVEHLVNLEVLNDNA